jgi:hypothetical protein
MISLDKHGRVISHGFDGAELPEYSDQEDVIFGADSRRSVKVREIVEAKRKLEARKKAADLAAKRRSESLKSLKAQKAEAKRAKKLALKTQANERLKAKLIVAGRKQPTLGYDFGGLLGDPFAGFSGDEGREVRQSLQWEASDHDIDEVDQYGNTQLGISFKKIGKGIAKVAKTTAKVAYSPVKATAKIQAAASAKIGQAVTSLPVLKQIDKYTGGVVSGGLKAAEVSGKVASGQKVSKEELKQALIGGLKVGAAALTVGGISALAAKGATAAGKDLGVAAAKKAGLGDTAAQIVGAAGSAAAGGAASGTTDITSSALDAGKAAAIEEAKKKNKILGAVAQVGVTGDLPSVDELKSQAMALDPVALAEKKLAGVSSQLNITRLASVIDVPVAKLPDLSVPAVERAFDAKEVLVSEADKVADLQIKQSQAEAALKAAKTPEIAAQAAKEAVEAAQATDKAKLEASVKVAAASQGRYWKGFESDHPMFQLGLV